MSLRVPVRWRSRPGRFIRLSELVRVLRERGHVRGTSKREVGEIGFANLRNIGDPEYGATLSYGEANDALRGTLETPIMH